MTREEAIEYNKNLKEYMKITDKESEYKFLKENYEALEMGISALEKQEIYDDGEHYVTISKALYDKLNVDVCEDTVSREAVNNLQRYRYNCGDTTITCISLKSVNELPSVAPICKEREKGKCTWYAG